MSPWGLGGPDSAGRTVRHRGRPRDGAPHAKVETHCTELMLQVCLGTSQELQSRDSVLPAALRCLLAATIPARTLQK
jgi:hypothetical protein